MLKPRNGLGVYHLLFGLRFPKIGDMFRLKQRSLVKVITKCTSRGGQKINLECITASVLVSGFWPNVKKPSDFAGLFNLLILFSAEKLHDELESDIFGFYVVWDANTLEAFFEVATGF